MDAASTRLGKDAELLRIVAKVGVAHATEHSLGVLLLTAEEVSRLFEVILLKAIDLTCDLVLSSHLHHAEGENGEQRFSSVEGQTKHISQAVLWTHAEGGLFCEVASVFVEVRDEGAEGPRFLGSLDQGALYSM